MHYEVSLTIRAPRDKTYAAYTDFESVPKWSGGAKSVTVLERQGNTVRLENVSAGGGKSVREMKLFPPQRVEYGGETRVTKTLSAVKFRVVPDGTEVTASLDVEFKGRWGWIMKAQGKAQAEASALRELTSFGKYVESLP